MPDDITIHKGDGAALLAMLDEVTDLYLALRADQPHASSPLFRRDTFRSRTTGQAERKGFAVAWAATEDAGLLVGFAFGLKFPAGRWWSGNPTMPPPEILDAPKFAVIELDVAASHQGRGIGRRLLDDLADRPERYAILTAIPDAPARQMYARWGWEQVGTAQHSPDSPVMDQLVLRLQ